jgi:transmembrane sensor
MRKSSHHRPSETEAIAATAAAWLAQRDEGFAPEQAAEFARWRALDERHEAAVARLEATWAVLQQLREFRPEATRHPDRDLLRAPAGRRRVLRFSQPAVTAALAAALVLAAVWWFPAAVRRSEPAWPTYATTADGYERVVLADGSILELNSASEITVAFSAAERCVRLVRGEAHFTVAKNPLRPFRVEAGTVAVRAVGTAFNVKLGPKDVEVLVTEGRVAIAGSEVGGQPALRRRGEAEKSEVGGPLVVPSSQTELGTNERIVIPAFGLPTAPVVPRVVEKVTPAAVREALAWQGPRLVFADTPLADAVAQFNRRNPVQLELADADLGALPIGGSFRAENVDAFVRLLVSGGDVEAQRVSATRIVLRKTGSTSRPQ